MMKKLFLSFLLISFLLIGISNSALASNSYVVEWYGQNGTTSYVPAFYSPNISNSNTGYQITARGNLTGTTYSTATGIYSPYNILLATMGNDFTGNQQCAFLGSMNNPTNPIYTGNSIEIKSITTTSGTLANITTDAKYNYHGSIRDLVFILNDSIFDSNGYMKNFYSVINWENFINSANYGISQSATNGNATIALWKFINDYNNCEGLKSINSTYTISAHSLGSYLSDSVSPHKIALSKYNILMGSAYSDITMKSYFFVFNSSSNGMVNISLFINATIIDAGLDVCGNSNTYVKIQYAKIEQNPSIISLSEILGGTINEQLILTPNINYVLQIAYGYAQASGAGSCYRNFTDVIDGFVSIDTYIPTWVCGNYGECFNGSRSRQCNDTSGLTPPKIENDVCYTLPEKSLDIGFEDVVNEDVWFVQPSWFCLPAYTSKSVEYPDGWNVNNMTNPRINDSGTNETAFIYDNIKMTREDKTKGIYSLKLWYLPPQQYLPSCTYASDCPLYNDMDYCQITPYGNYTCGNAPQLEKNINETWAISKNFSFNYPNVTISFDARKCSSPEQEWSGNSSLFGICGEGYYTNDKTSNWNIQDTDVYFSIYDYTASHVVYVGTAKLSSIAWYTYNLRLSNLDITHLYQLRLNILIYTSIESKVYCAMIDNVNINAYSGAIQCVPYCDAQRNYHELISVSPEGDCAFKLMQVSPKCFPSGMELILGGCGKACICNKDFADYLTYYEGNNETGFCKWTITPSSDYCIDYCKTQNLIGIPSIGEAIDKLSLFFSPMFLIVYVIMGLASFIAYKTKSWQIFAIVIIIGFLIASVVWIEMAFIGICIMLVVIYFLAKEHGKPSGGGN